MSLDLAAFSDEFIKIAEWHIRTGRKPISVEKLIENSEEALTPSEILEKKSWVKPTATAGAAIVGYEALRRANEDRKTGRIMRLQQGM